MAGKPSILYWVDHTSGFDSNTGVQRVTRLLARHLLESGAPLRFVCWDARAKSLRPATGEELEVLSRFHGPRPPPQGNGDREVEPLVVEKGQWLFIPEVPLVTRHRSPPTEPLFSWAKKKGLRTGWIFYDAIPWTTPGYEKARPAHEEYMLALLGADLVLPISFSAERDLLSFWRQSGKANQSVTVKTRVLPGEFPGVPRASFSEPPGETVNFLSVGSVDHRKNHLRLLSAFRRFCMEYPQTDIRLTIAGHIAGDLYSRVMEFADACPKIDLLGFIPDERLQGLYAQCHATVFPSVSEGFGLPILESIWYGKPCLCANFGAMGEVAGGGGGCLTMDTHFSAEIFEGIRRVSLDPSFRRDLGLQAAGRKMKSWEGYAAEISQALEVR